MVPGTEAPAEMHFFIHEYKALCTAENACHNLHNLYKKNARGRQDPQRQGLVVLPERNTGVVRGQGRSAVRPAPLADLG